MKNKRHYGGLIFNYFQSLGIIKSPQVNFYAVNVNDRLPFLRVKFSNNKKYFILLENIINIYNIDRSFKWIIHYKNLNYNAIIEPLICYNSKINFEEINKEEIINLSFTEVEQFSNFVIQEFEKEKPTSL